MRFRLGHPFRFGRFENLRPNEIGAGNTAFFDFGEDFLPLFGNDVFNFYGYVLRKTSSPTGLRIRGEKYQLRLDNNATSKSADFGDFTVVERLHDLRVQFRRFVFGQTRSHLLKSEDRGDGPPVDNLERLLQHSALLRFGNTADLLIAGVGVFGIQNDARSGLRPHLQ